MNKSDVRKMLVSTTATLIVALGMAGFGNGLAQAEVAPTTKTAVTSEHTL